MMKSTEIRQFFDILKKIDPAPRSDLVWTNPYTLLVAVTLSAQATDVGVNKATKDLFKIADTPEKMLALGIDRLKDHIKTIGLYNNKAKNVIAMAEILIKDHNSIVPEDRDALMKLPGVGRKTANVVLNEAFGHHTMAVDTHIFRVANRTGMAKGKTPDQIEKGLLKVIPDDYMRHAHHWLILHGRYMCKARKPDCANCPVYDLCGFKEKTA